MKYVDYLCKKAVSLGATQSLFINPSDIVFEERVNLICINSCHHSGNNLLCPPIIPKIDYKKAINEYNTAIVVILETNVKNLKDFNIERPKATNKLHGILLKLEKEAFNEGYPLVTSFIGGSCRLCSVCSDVCKNPGLSRIPIEATGVNVIETLKAIHIDVKFPVKKYKTFKRVGLLLLK